jgi:hypothetical protein
LIITNYFVFSVRNFGLNLACFDILNEKKREY